MERKFITVNQDEIDIKIAENIRSREMELMSYDFERANHENAIAKLEAGGIVWDDTTTPYRGLSRDVMIVRALAEGLSSEKIQQISDLNVLEAHKMNLEAVKSEVSKSERHYENLLETLPEGGRRDKAITEAKNREDARKIK